MTNYHSLATIFRLTLKALGFFDVDTLFPEPIDRWISMDEGTVGKTTTKNEKIKKKILLPLSSKNKRNQVEAKLGDWLGKGGCGGGGRDRGG